MKSKLKNIVLLLMLVFSSVRRCFFKNEERVEWYIFTPESLNNGIRIDWMVYFYTISINFLILAYCLKYPFGISKKIKDSILVMCILDFLHLVLYAGVGFEFFKILIWLIIIVLRNPKIEEWKPLRI